MNKILKQVCTKYSRWRTAAGRLKNVAVIPSLTGNLKLGTYRDKYVSARPPIKLEVTKPNVLSSLHTRCHILHTPKTQLKTTGSTLATTIFTTGIILGLALGFARIVLSNTLTSADFLHGERAYFAAESGVEAALLELNEHPVRNWDQHPVLVEGGTRGEVTIKNNVGSLSDGNSDPVLQGVILSGYGNAKLRLKVDNGTNLIPNFSPVLLNRLRVHVAKEGTGESPEDGDYWQWKIQCQKISPIDQSSNTVSIIGEELLTRQAVTLSSLRGNFDNEYGQTHPVPITVREFWNNKLGNSSLSRRQAQMSCFLSFQNLSEIPLRVQLTGMRLSPPRAPIVSEGVAGERRKLIEFNYAQKNLSSFFDFGIVSFEE